MGHLSTHVLYTAHGCPAAGMRVTLQRIGADGRVDNVKAMVLDDDGRNPDGPLLEGIQKPVGMATVAFLRQDRNVHKMGHPAPQPVPQAPDPVTDLVAENEVAFIERAGPSGRILFLLEDLREPRCKVLVLLHVTNRQLAHLPPSPMGDSHPFASNTNAMSDVPVL